MDINNIIGEKRQEVFEGLSIGREIHKAIKELTNSSHLTLKFLCLCPVSVSVLSSHSLAEVASCFFLLY